MGRRSPPKMPLQITTRRSGTPDFKFELLPLHSPLLGQSLLVSFPPLIDMLKFSGYPYLIRGVPSLRSSPPDGRARAGSLAASRRQCEISRSATLQASRPFIPARWQPARARHRRHDRAFTGARALTGDARTGMPPRVPGGAMCVQRFDDSLNSAIHITYRISLRSSSMREPRDPLLKVFCFRIPRSPPSSLARWPSDRGHAGGLGGIVRSGTSPGTFARGSNRDLYAESLVRKSPAGGRRECFGGTGGHQSGLQATRELQSPRWRGGRGGRHVGSSRRGDPPTFPTVGTAGRPRRVFITTRVAPARAERGPICPPRAVSRVPTQPYPLPAPAGETRGRNLAGGCPTPSQFN